MRALDLMLMRYTLAAVWLMTGVLSLGVFPQQESLALLAHAGLHGAVSQTALYGSASLDIVLGMKNLPILLLLWLLHQHEEITT